MGRHDLLFDKKIVGTVTVLKEGMFYKLQCKYNPFDNKIYCLYCADQINLGVCLPVMTIRVKKNQLCLGEFSLKPKLLENNSQIVSLDNMKAYYILRNITDLRMRITDNGSVVIIKNQEQDSRDSDQNR